MNRKAGIAGAAVLGLVLNANAYTSSYASMAAAGDFNGWNTTPNMVLAADNVWVTTQTFAAADGKLKFAANGSWAINWGGNAVFVRVPATASAPTPGGGDNIFNSLSNGPYRITFNDTNFEFRVEWAGGSPLPLPAFTNVSLVGGFNGWIPGLNQMTNPPGNTNLWMCSVDLEAETAFQFYPNGIYSNQYGAPASVSLPVPVADASACGKSDITLSGFEPGTFQFSLNTSNATYSISQTSTQSFTLMAVQGDFIATNNPPPNMMQVSGSTLWESDHHITNSGTITLRFSGNNGARRWGATNSTPAYSLPAEGSAVANQTNFAQITGVVPGRYRITFNHQSGAFTLRQSYTNGSGINLLDNPGFEDTTLGDDGGDAVDWTQSQAWPKSWTNDFAPHSGRWCGAIYGKNYHPNDYGSFSQDVLVTSGRTYRAAAWFKATADWTAESMQIKIEWRNATNGAVGSESIVNLPALTTNWVQYSVEGTAPTNATQAHVVFLCAGAETTGTMHVDDAEFRAIAGRTQDFDTWGALIDFAPFAPDWSVTSGKVVYNVPPGRPPAEVFISQYVEGTGNNKAVEIYNGTLSNINLTADGYVLQQYHNGSLTVSVSIALSGTLASGNALVVGRPSTPTNYAPDLAIAGLPNLQTNKDLTFNGDDVLVLRKGTNILDRVGQVGTNAVGSLWGRGTRDRTLARKQTVFTGTLTAVTADFPAAEWEVSASDTFAGLGSHEISYLDPNEPYTPAGYSLVMDCGATLMSGELPGGAGDISFYWRTESMAPSNTMVIETAPAEDGPWTEVVTLADVASSNFAYYVAAINRADAYYLRIRQTDGGTNRFRIDEIAISAYEAIPRLQDFNAWTSSDYEVPGTYSRSGWTIQNAVIAPTDGVTATRAALLTPPDSAVLCPAFEGGVGEFRFWAKALNKDQPARLLLQTTVDSGSNWVTRDTLNLTTAKTFATWLYVTNFGAQARLIFDPVYDSGEAVVDNVEVRLPALYRSQNFDGWPSKSGWSNGVSSYQGWLVTNCIVDAQNAYAGQAARLNTTIGNYVQSPEIPDGIGSISFRAAKWPGDTSPGIDVQLSPNGTSWITFTNVSASSSNYQAFLWYLLDTSNRFVRFSHASGAGKALLDDIEIGLPLPRPQVLVTPSLDPASPYYEDTLRINANVVSRYGADVLSVTGAYQIAAGATSFVQMASTEIGAYVAVSEIPAQAAGTMIRYFVTVRYAGIGANSNFTGYGTNSYTTAVYTNYVSSVPLGHVWINEVFYAPYDTEPYDTNYIEYVGYNHEFIELCGRAGVSISNWTIQLLFGADADVAKNGGQAVYASYKITSGHTFTNQTNTFSFYVLGDAELATNYPVNKYLTTYVSTNVAPYAVIDKDHIYDGVGVIRLLNEYSNLVYALSYGGYASGADRIPQSQPSFGATNSLGLKGSNYTYTGFTWSNGTITAGAPNSGQNLTEPPPDSNVYAYAWHTQALKITPLNTNSVPPFYMLDPENPAHFDNIGVYYGYTNADYPTADGTLYHRYTGAGGWSTLDMNIRDGSLDAAGHAYAYGTIPDHTYRRQQTIEYVLEVIPNKTGIERVYLGSDAGGANISTVYTNLAGAQAHPFTYLVPIGDQIYITNFAHGATSVVFGTEGNDMQDPLTNFYIKVATNIRTPTSLWFSTNFTAVRDIYSNYTFTVPKATSRWSNVFYRVDPRWP